MRRQISIDGKIYQVDVAECPIGSPFTVKVNDKPREVVLEQEPESAKSFSIKVNGKSYKVELPSIGKNSSFSIKVNNVPLKAELKPATLLKTQVPTLSPISSLAPKSTKILGEGVIAAPMAGKIISVRVKKGDSVKMGSVLCVLEAMKMENEISAPKGGVVEEVRVQEGKNVNEGDILILIK